MTNKRNRMSSILDPELIGQDNRSYLEQVLADHPENLAAATTEIVTEAKKGFSAHCYMNRRVDLMLQLHAHIAQNDIPANAERAVRESINFSDTLITALLHQPQDPCKPWDFYPGFLEMATRLAYGALRSVHQVFGEFSEEAILRRTRIAEVCQVFAESIQSRGKENARDADAKRSIRINAADTFPALERASRRLMDQALTRVRENIGEVRKSTSVNNLLLDEPIGDACDKTSREFVRVQMHINFAPNCNKYCFLEPTHDLADMIAAAYWNASSCYLQTPATKDRDGTNKPVSPSRTIVAKWIDGNVVRVTMSASRVVLNNDELNTPHIFRSEPRLIGDKCWTDKTIRAHKLIVKEAYADELKAVLAKPGRTSIAVEGSHGSGKLFMLMRAAEQLNLDPLQLRMDVFHQQFPIHDKLVLGLDEAGRAFFGRSESPVIERLRQALANPEKHYLIVLDECEKMSEDERNYWLRGIEDRVFDLGNGKTVRAGDNVRFVLVGPVGMMNLLTLGNTAALDRWYIWRVPSVHVDQSFSMRGEGRLYVDRWSPLKLGFEPAGSASA